MPHLHRLVCAPAALPPSRTPGIPSVAGPCNRKLRPLARSPNCLFYLQPAPRADRKRVIDRCEEGDEYADVPGRWFGMAHLPGAVGVVAGAEADGVRAVAHGAVA